MTSCNGRFTDCDSSEFPEVWNYNYTGNTKTRSLNNRSFRWEDVTIRSIYLYNEATISGSFENNRYTTLHSVTNNTGVNYITNHSTLSDSTSYPGWTVTGGYTLWIGTSGARFSGNSLSGLTGSFNVHPIERNESIGLYSWTGYNSSPKIISNIIATGSSGIIPDGVHQVYGLFRLSYYSGNTAQIQIYPRGWNSNTIVAYYNYFTETWQTTAVSSGIQITNSGYHEIKYTFTASDFPAATPTGYDLFVSTPTTGAFIVADDLHIDARLKKNAFIDDIVPSGYVIQVTPDLGWHNILSMFESDLEQNKNPYLKTLGIYATELGNLEDNLDNTVTATIDESDFSSAINSRYNKYLWRAIAVGNEGNLGKAGIPQKFEYIGDIVDQQFDITSVSDNHESPVKVIIGKKNKRSTILVNGSADHPGLEYNSDTTWKLTISVDCPKKTISLQAVDLGGALSSIRYVELINTTFEQEQQSLWNSFDEHGMLMDVERLPGESNKDYSARIKDVMVNKGGASLQGILNGATRELGLLKIPNGIILSIPNINEQPVTRSVDVEVGSTYIKFRSDNMILEEKIYVDPIYKTAILSKDLEDFPYHCQLEDGKDISQNLISTHPDNEEFFVNTKIIINDPDAIGKYITVKYRYYETIKFKDRPTLGDLSQAINSFVDNSNNNILYCEFSDLLSGNESCLGLYQSFITVESTSPSIIPWSHIQIKKISDKSFRAFNLDTENYKRSKFYKYVSQLKLNSRTLWGSVEADRDYWDSANRTDLSFDHLPTLMDPRLSEFYSNLSGESTRIENVQAWGRSYRGFSSETMYNIGINSNAFQPGVGFNKDLEPTIHRTTTFKFSPTEEYLNIIEERQDNNYVLFSGER